MIGVVLLPGAGMSEWLWTKFVNEITSQYLIISPRFENNTKERRLCVTFDEIIEYHKAKIEAKKWDRVIIVGHSGAGLIAGTLAKIVPNVVSVIFVSANIPQNNTTAIDIFPEEIQKRTIESISKQAEFDYIPIKDMESFFIGAFANKCTEEDKNYIRKQNFIPEPICVVNAKMNWDNFPIINKKYIVCINDKTISKDQQEQLARNLEIDDLVYLDSDHLPMISFSNEFTEIIENEIKEFS